jgi:hypothetical protein
VPEPSPRIGTNSTSPKPLSAKKPAAPRAAGGRLRLCRTVELPRINDPRGNLTFMEGGFHVPFDIQRVYYVYDVPGGAERGGHAHKALQQFIIAVTGSFDVVLDDGRESRRVRLDRAYRGLYVTPMIWRELRDFTSGSVCLVLASAPFDENDYFRNYRSFVQAVQGET